MTPSHVYECRVHAAELRPRLLQHVMATLRFFVDAARHGPPTSNVPPRAVAVAAVPGTVRVRQPGSAGVQRARP